MIGLYEATTNGWSGEGMALPLVDPSNPILLACHNLSFILCLEFHIANISPSLLVVSSCAAPVSLLAWPYLLLHYIPYPQAYVSNPLPLSRKKKVKNLAGLQNLGRDDLAASMAILGWCAHGSIQQLRHLGKRPPAVVNRQWGRKEVGAVLDCHQIASLDVILKNINFNSSIVSIIA